MENHDIAAIFREISMILELKGENIFRIRAYERAAQSLDNLQEEVREIIKKKSLTEITGIGADLAGKIKELIETGKLKYYEQLKREIPEGLIGMMKIPGLGPKTVRKLYEKLGLDTVEKLEEATIKGKLLKLEGIRSKTEENILRGIALLKKGSQRQPLNIAIGVAQDFVSRLKKIKHVDNIAIAGSLRRKKDTIKDVDILVVSDKPKVVMESFVHFNSVQEILAHGDTKSSVISKQNGMQVDLRVIKRENFGSALIYFTGSKEFNIRLRQLAIKKGYKINEYGVFKENAKDLASERDNISEKRVGRRVAGTTEEQVFSFFKMAYIPPELREDRGEISVALKNKLPKLVELKDIKGDFHIHSNYSDGIASMAEIANKIKEFNYEYIAICDHSQGLKVAGGLSKEQVYKKLRELEKIRKSVKTKLLFGTEVDITSDGSLDYPESVLKEFDVVISAIHSGFKQSKEQLTKRIVNACKNKYTNIIAHPTGKLHGMREPYDIDIDEICKAASDNQVALEINCYPQRLDLSDTGAMRVKKHGVKIALGTDAHQLDQLQYMEFGVSVARRGWLEKKDIINCLSFDKLTDWLDK